MAPSDPILSLNEILKRYTFEQKVNLVVEVIEMNKESHLFSLY